MSNESMTAALIEAMESISPIIDAADGMRADLERRGWSPTASEQVAQAWLMGAIASSWGGGR